MMMSNEKKKIIKIHPQIIKNRQGGEGGENHPSLGALPDLKDVGILWVNNKTLLTTANCPRKAREKNDTSTEYLFVMVHLIIHI